MIDKNKKKGKKKSTTKKLDGPLGGDLDRRAKRRASMGAMYQSDSSIGNKQSKARKARGNKKNK